MSALQSLSGLSRRKQVSNRRPKSPALKIHSQLPPKVQYHPELVNKRVGAKEFVTLVQACKSLITSIEFQAFVMEVIKSLEGFPHTDWPVHWIAGNAKTSSNSCNRSSGSRPSRSNLLIKVKTGMLRCFTTSKSFWSGPRYPWQSPPP